MEKSKGAGMIALICLGLVAGVLMVPMGRSEKSYAPFHVNDGEYRVERKNGDVERDMLAYIVGDTICEAGGNPAFVPGHKCFPLDSVARIVQNDLTYYLAAGWPQNPGENLASNRQKWEGLERRPPFAAYVGLVILDGLGLAGH
jgi:hypothetical protein